MSYQYDFLKVIKLKFIPLNVDKFQKEFLYLEGALQVVCHLLLKAF